jgi:uncharacterized membrane protein
MRAIRLLAAAALTGALALMAPVPSMAATPPQVTTAYPGVEVGPGQTTSFPLTVTATGRQRVALSVTQSPDGWTTLLRGGGFVIDAVYTDPTTPPDVQLDVQVPADAAEGTYQVAVQGSSAGGTSTLDLTITVSSSTAGSVELTTDFPVLNGASDATFPFDLTLTNNTPQAITFNLEAQGPEGWQVDARPSGQQQASTAKVDAGSSSTITVTADPPDDVTAGQYPVAVRATGGGQAAEASLEVDITGSFAMTLTTPDQRLNAEVSAGGASAVTLVVSNDGSAPLSGVTFSSSPPTGWTVTFKPETVQQVAPGQQARVQATITPSGDAVAGDYMVTMTATTQETSASADFRTTVKTSSFLGLVGIVLIVAAVGVLIYVFYRYGRR